MRAHLEFLTLCLPSAEVPSHWSQGSPARDLPMSQVQPLGWRTTRKRGTVTRPPSTHLPPFTGKQRARDLTASPVSALRSGATEVGSGERSRCDQTS